MSALAYMAGIAQGVGEEYSKQAADKRQFQQQKDLVTGDALLKSIQNDDTADWGLTQARLQNYYKIMGVPDKDAQQLIQHHKGIYDQAQAQKQSATPPIPSGVGASQLAPPVSGNGAAPDLQGSDASVPGLPPMPQMASPVTTGEVRQQQAAREALGPQGSQAVTAQGVRTTGAATNQVAADAIPARVQGVVQGVKAGVAGGLDQQTAELAAGVYGKNAATILHAHTIPQVKDGADYIGQTDVNGNPVVAGKFYNLEVNGLGQPTAFTPTTFQPKVGPWVTLPDGTYGQSQLGPNGQITGVLTHDNAGNRIVPKPDQIKEAQTQQVRVDPVTGQITKIPVTNTSRVTYSPAPQSGAITPLSPPPTMPPPAGAHPQSAPPKGFIGIYGSPQGTLPDPGSHPLMIGGKPINSDLDANINYLTGQVASGRIKLNDVKGDGTSISQKQMQGLVQQNMAARGLDINKITISQLDTAQFAKSLENKLPHIYAEIDALDKAGKLGVIASRYNEFMRAKGYEDLPNDVKAAIDPASFTALQTDLGLLNTALMKIHTGSRGSTTIMTKFGNLINGGNMTAPVLKASVHAAERWIHTYADLVPTGDEALNKTGVGRGGAVTSATPLTPIPSNEDAIVNDLIKQYGSKK